MFVFQSLPWRIKAWIGLSPLVEGGGDPACLHYIKSSNVLLFRGQARPAEGDYKDLDRKCMDLLARETGWSRLVPTCGLDKL